MTTQVRDRPGATYADRSTWSARTPERVAADLDLPFEGPGAVGGALHVIFEADLSRFVEYRPSVLYWMVQPAPRRRAWGWACCG